VKKIALGLLCCCALLSVTAQTKKEIKKQKAAERKAELDAIVAKEEEGTIVYDKQNIFGAQLNTDGFGFIFEKGKFKTPRLSTSLRFELGERYDSREYKVSQLFNGGGTTFSGDAYKYGKINNFYFFRATYGEQRLIGNKSPRNGVAVSYVYAAGATIGLLKPYRLKTELVTGTKAYKWDPNDSTAVKLFTNPNAANLLVRPGGPFDGWSELKIVPGLHAKAGLRFDYGRYNRQVTALECGLTLDYMFGDTPILLSYDNINNKFLDKGDKNIYFGAYVNVLFGNRK
jgi:hypothetical protein